MAVQKKTSKGDTYIGLPYDTIVDVVAINGQKVVIKRMTYGESLKIKKVKGWAYSSFQPGFHSYKNN